MPLKFSTVTNCPSVVHILHGENGVKRSVYDGFDRLEKVSGRKLHRDHVVIDTLARTGDAIRFQITFTPPA